MERDSPHVDLIMADSGMSRRREPKGMVKTSRHAPFSCSLAGRAHELFLLRCHQAAISRRGEEVFRRVEVVVCALSRQAFNSAASCPTNGSLIMLR